MVSVATHATWPPTRAFSASAAGQSGSPCILSAEKETRGALPPPYPPPKSLYPSYPGKVFTTQIQTLPHTPPPLLPRPPASYIQETAEEDAWLVGER